MIDYIQNLFYIDPLAIVMIVLVGFIGVTVGNFASRYLHGNTHYYHFFWMIFALVTSIIIMVSADNLLLLLVAWGVANTLLVKLMIYKSNWRAAKASGMLAAKYYLLGFLFISSAFALFYIETGESSLQKIIHHYDSGSPMLITALILLGLGAMTQSALWPFHKWLLSSLNSPTPVSAIMHAGLINGGGFLLARFAPLYLEKPRLLTLLFIIGIGTSLIGTLFKLIQSDAKRMLACSTMGQMGFMMAQCGLGLFPAAIAHLCWHGLFKAYLFLASGNITQEKRLFLGYPPNLVSFLCALICGGLGSYMFCLASEKIWLTYDTTLVLTVVAFITTAHSSFSILGKNPLKKLPLAAMTTALIGGLYGLSVHTVEFILKPMNIMQPQTLNIFYIIGLMMLITCWLLFLFWQKLDLKGEKLKTITHMYVMALNASQPHTATVTTHRNDYKYL